MPRRTLEKGNWPPYNVKSILRSVEAVLKHGDIGKLTQVAYDFIIMQMGFIAHYNLQGFRDTYKDLRHFCRNLRTSEYSRDPDYNLHDAERYCLGKFFVEQYGKAYGESRRDAILGIIHLVDKYERKVDETFSEREKAHEVSVAQQLAEHHGYKLVKA